MVTDTMKADRSIVLQLLEAEPKNKCNILYDIKETQQQRYIPVLEMSLQLSPAIITISIQE